MTRLLLLLAMCTASYPATLQATSSVALAQQRAATEDSQPTQTPPAEEPAPEPDWTEQRALVDAAFAALERSDFNAAREQVSKAIDALFAVEEAVRGPAWLRLLDRAGLAAWNAKDLVNVQRAWEEALVVRSRTLPADHPNLQATRGNLAAVRYTLGDLEGARVLQEAVLEVQSQTLPPDHPDLQMGRSNLAATLSMLGDLRRARALQEAVLEVRSRILPEGHPDLQTARGNLAVTTKRLGDLHGARALEEAVLEARSRTLPADHPDLQTARGNLGATLGLLGDLQGARALQESVLEYRSRTLRGDHPDLQQARSHLALTLYMLGDLQGARALEEAVLEVYSRTLPADHPDLQTMRGNLAVTMRRLGDLTGARALEEAVLEVRSRTQPADHPDLQTARLNLAMTRKAFGDLPGARALEEAVLEVSTRTLPADHPDLQMTRANLAATLHDLGDLEGARTLEEAVLEVRSRTLPADHPDLQSARGNLSVTLAGLAASAARSGENEGEGEGRGRNRTAEGEWTRALALVSEGASGAGAVARAALGSSAAREAEERVSSRVNLPLARALSFAAGLGEFERSETLFARAFELSEASRAAGLAGATLARAPIEPAERERLGAEIRAAGEELAGLAQRGATREEYHLARARRETAERELLALARARAREGVGALEFDAERLARALGAKRAVVGFRRYARSWLEATESAGEPEVVQFELRSRASLGAFVLRSAEGEAHLEFVDLGAVADVEPLVVAWREAIRATPERGLGLAASAEDPALALGRRLRSAVWDPLVQHLGDAERVVVALDDVLHLVPLDALPLTEGVELVGDRWRIETRLALWELLDGPRPASERVALVSLGGASFNSEPKHLEEADLAALEAAPDDPTAPAGTLALAMLRGGPWERGFAPLSYTRLEARGLADLFEEAFAERFVDGAPARVLERAFASREALVEAAPKARYLHVATHGWFAPESIRSWADVPDEGESPSQRRSGEDTVRGMSPMLLCGLALAGANLPPNAAGRVPGLVTAEELSGFDLTGCELAVLSACDTNVGERRAGQGVASLQKALHMAGARSVITSLWKVPDEATSELMLDFYRRLWVEKKPKHQALWEAKLRLRNARDERGEPLHTTRDWAAWVLTGDPN